MFPRSVLSSAIVFGIVALALPGRAQQGSGSAQTQQTPEVLPPAEGGPNGPADGAQERPEKKRPAAPTAGYAYADKPTASAKSASHVRYRSHGPVVNMPGFEQTADGGSRLFVQLSQNVPVEERKSAGGITYVLKGASPRVHNNTNALVTVHFNTPVTSARLVPHGQDLHFVVELRSAATPTWKVNEGADKSSVLTIDFPKGDYLQAAPSTPTGDSADAEQAPPTKATPKAARGKRGAVKAPPMKKDEAPADGPKP